jgi:hypothetical protein
MNFKKYSKYQNNQNLLINQPSQNNQKPNPISMAKLIQENENLSLALKQEIIKNEEQESYIQSLKETIESNLSNSGFLDILASSKEYQQFQQYNKGQGKTMADFVVDFIKFKEETNKDKNNKKNLNLNKNDFYQDYITKIKDKMPLILKPNEQCIKDNEYKIYENFKNNGFKLFEEDKDKSSFLNTVYRILKEVIDKAVGDNSPNKINTYKNYKQENISFCFLSFDDLYLINKLITLSTVFFSSNIFRNN